MDGALLKDIFERSYANELVECIRSNGNVDDFIKNLEEKQSDEQQSKIYQFVEYYKKVLEYPSDISKEEILKSGLSEQYIERQIMESKFPGEAFRSIRRMYEQLDRPAAPMVAFRREYAGGDIVEKLKQKGFDVATEDDERAVNTDVFVVDKQSRTINAPFLAPDEALKANIAMIDAIYECGSEAYLSSPRTRETFAIATHEPLSQEEGVGLDLEIIASHYSKDNYERVMNNFYQECIEGEEPYKILCNFIDHIKPRDLDLHDKIIKEGKERFPRYLSSDLLKEIEEEARKILVEHKEEFMPYVKYVYQYMMKEEAFEKGIDSHIPDKENIEMLEQNKPITSVFHGGKKGGLPYSIFARRKEKNMIHTYAASMMDYEVYSGGSTSNNPVGYAVAASCHNARSFAISFGFVYEYKSRGENQEMLLLDSGSKPFDGGKFVAPYSDETAVYPHQNKLKKIYIATKRDGVFRVLPLEVDEEGKVKDARWREFVELHNPVDDTLSGFMVDRQNNMIAEYDKLGKEKMMDRRLSIDIGAKNISLPINSENESVEKVESLSAVSSVSVAEMSEKEKYVFFKALSRGENMFLNKHEEAQQLVKNEEQTKVTSLQKTKDCQRVIVNSRDKDRD